MEDWFLFGEDSFYLKDLVVAQLNKRGFLKEYIIDMPYIVCSTRNFEQLLQVSNNHEIIDIMDNWKLPENNGHNFGQFLYTNYGSEFKSINEYFPDDFKDIYSPS